tara:strand:- start:913 stop:1182 length:270 start_codon:yes stop_codon:yes gene_type:complete
MVLIPPEKTTENGVYERFNIEKIKGAARSSPPKRHYLPASGKAADYVCNCIPIIPVYGGFYNFPANFRPKGMFKGFTKILTWWVKRGTA